METQTTNNPLAQKNSIITGIQMISVHVRDLTKVRTFYADVLGLRKTIHDAKVNADIYEIPGSATPLAVHQMFPNDPGRAPGTVSGIVLYVNDVVQAATEITRRGGRIVDAAEKSDHGTIFATVADPEGNEFLLTQK